MQDPSTISKEVKKHRASNWYHKGSFLNKKNFCVHRYQCRKTNVCKKIILCGIKCTSCPSCNQTCKDFEKECCNRLMKAPYVCNGCSQKLHHCSIAHKYTYDARFADRKYRETLKDSRRGIKSFRKGSKRKGQHHYSSDCKGTIPLPDFSESSGITDVCSHHVLIH